MALLIKTGVVGGLITSVVLPVTITSSTGAKSVGLLDLNSLEKVEKQAPAKNTLEALSRAGYRKKNKDELTELNKNRVTVDWGNFALGCHKLLFGGRGVFRLNDDDRNTKSGFRTGSPMKDYLGDKKQPLLGCSTASVMKWPNKENVYEFELAVRRGNRGFLERITVWEKTKKAESQLVIYTKESSGSQYSWFSLYGIHRKITEKEGFEIGNPITDKWSNLEIKNEQINKPEYFSVWVEDTKESQGSKSMLDGLGIKTKSDKKLFSSVAKAEKDNDWYFNFFGTGKQFTSRFSVNIYPEYGVRYYATYNSEIAEDVQNLRGAWQDVSEFCKSQEDKEKENLPHADAERLRDYCYTNQPKSNRKN